MLRLYFLGMPRIERDDRPVELPAKAVALLAYLADTAGPVPRDRILGLLWGESAEDAARKNLRNTLWTIRRGLGDSVVRAEGDRLTLSGDVWVDSRGWPPADASSETALALYRGPFLDGLTVNEAPEYELWLMMERERLAQSFLRAVAAAIRLHQARGAWRDVLAVARRGLAQDNLHEPFYRALMEAHARLGERAEALRQYEVLRSLLERELGVEPLPETEALAAALPDLAADTPAGEHGGPAAETVLLPRERTPAQRQTAESHPFIGRSHELAALSEEYDRADAGETRVVLLYGELGIGKTRLWHEWAGRAWPAATPVLEARCLEATQDLPFAPLTDVLSDDVRLAEIARAGRVPRVWLAEAARLLPQLRAAIPDLPRPAALPPEEERRRIFEALVLLLAAFDAHPLVLFIDDVHWLDTTTLDWLAYLVHRLRDRGLLLVLTYRPEDAPPHLVRQVATWHREGPARRLPLARLNPDEAAALVASLPISPHLAALLHAHSAGNPYFLLELGSHSSALATEGDLLTGVPTALADLIRARLERLPDPVRQVAQAAAVLEPDFELTTLRRTSGRSEEEMLDAIDALLGAGILTERAAHGASSSTQVAFFFAHPLVATVIRDGLSATRRQFLHRRAAQALEAAHSTRLAPVAGRLLIHWRAAGDAERAAHYADLAAQHALSLAAAAEAANYLRQAIALAAAPSRRVVLGDALSQLGDLPAARTAFAAALTHAVAEGDRPSAARACLGMAQTYLPGGRADDVVQWAERSLEYLDAAADPAAHAHAHYLFGAGRLRAGGAALAEADRHLAEAAQLAAAHGATSIAALSRFELGNLLAERGDLQAAIAVYEEAIRLSEAAGNPNQQVLSHNNAAYHAMLAGELPQAHAHISAALALTERLDLRLPLQYLYSTRGEIALAEEQWTEAETWFRRSLAEAETNGNIEQAAKARANLALAARGRGDLDEALQLLEEAATLAAPLTTRYLQVQLDLWLAEVRLARGERRAARMALEQAEERLAGGEYRRLTEWAARIRIALA